MKVRATAVLVLGVCFLQIACITEVRGEMDTPLWDQKFPPMFAENQEYLRALAALTTQTGGPGINALRARAERELRAVIAGLQKDLNLLPRVPLFRPISAGPNGYHMCEEFVAGVQDLALVLDPDEAIRELLGHEAAHLIVCQLDPGETDGNHGPQWQLVMRRLGLDPATRFFISVKMHQVQAVGEVDAIVRKIREEYQNR